jgi:hypothetical protein
MYSQTVLFEGNDSKYNESKIAIYIFFLFFKPILIKDIYQLNLILQITGYPSADLMEQINQDARIYLENKEIKTVRVNFYNYFQHVIDSKDGIYVKK